MFGSLWSFNSPRPFNAPPEAPPDPPEPVVYDGATALEALQAWWTDQAELKDLFVRPDQDQDPNAGRLWHLEAPETTAEPYATVLLAAETERDGRTTGYAILDALVQITIHAETDEQAVAIRRAVRRAVRSAPLAVDGNPVLYVLPGGQTTGLGEGLGLGGRDCWVATLDVEIAHLIDD